MFNKKMSFEELSKIYGIEDVDEIYHEVLKNMIYYTNGFTKGGCPDSLSNIYRTIIGNYTQNFIIISYLIKLEKQNRKLTEQNQQVIELLTEIKNK